MKRVVLFALVLMLCAGALAENEYYGSPKMFMEENGLLVFTGDQLSEFGIGSINTDNGPDFSLSNLEITDGAGGIIWYQAKTKELFFAIDLTYLLSGGRRSNIPNIAKVYVDFCRTFKFELYRFRNDGVSVCCLPEASLTAFAFALGMKDDTEVTYVKTIDDMANRLKESMY